MNRWRHPLTRLSVFFDAGATAIGDGVLVGMGVSQLNELDDYINSTGKNPEGELMPENLEAAAEMMDEAKLEKSEEMAEKIEKSWKKRILRMR